MDKGETFDFLGFTYRKVQGKNSEKMVLITPKKKKVQNLINTVKHYLKENRSKKVKDIIPGLNSIVRGWVNYYRIGHSTRVFAKVRQWVEMKVRKYVRVSQGKNGFGWKEWSKDVIYGQWGLYDDYKIRYYDLKAKPI